MNTRSQTRKTVILYEDASRGHYFYYLRLLTQECLQRGLRVLIATPPDLLHSLEAEHYLGDLLQCVDTAELPGSDLRALETLSKRVQPLVTLIPNADHHLLPLLRRGGWRGHGALSCLVLRPATFATSNVARRQIRTCSKQAIMTALNLLPRIQVAVLRSPLWRGWSPFACARDPITLAPESRSVASSEQSRGHLPLVGILGNITERKNLPLVATACAQVARVRRFRFLIAGQVDADQMALAEDAVSTIESLGSIVTIDNRFLGEGELDNYIRDVHVLVLAHSNEGPSGLLSKACAVGTRVVAAGAASLRRDAARAVGLCAWVNLEVDAVSRAITKAIDLPRGTANLTPTMDEFAEVLLFPARRLRS